MEMETCAESIVLDQAENQSLLGLKFGALINLEKRCFSAKSRSPNRIHSASAQSAPEIANYEYTPFCNGPGDVKSPRVMSRRRAHASVRGRRRGRHTMLSEGTVSLSRYAWFVG
jgi:hypothetical protein